MLGAADTFRAAAVDQLKVWGERVGVEVVAQGMGADPAAVAFDTLQAAVGREADLVIVDTAGRLHNKVNLMNELGKIKRVMSKVVPEAPHEVWLVLDGSTGQNALEQAKRFTEVTDVTGLVLTKLDGTARGGAVFTIRDELGLPVRFIGTGETMEALEPFEPEAFVDALLAGGAVVEGMLFHAQGACGASRRRRNRFLFGTAQGSKQPCTSAVAV